MVVRTTHACWAVESKLRTGLPVFKVLKALILAVLGFTGIVLVYCFVALILSIIPVNGSPQKGDDITIFLLTNNVHSDLVLPVKSGVKDWSADVKFEHTTGKDTTYKYVGFGWGDKGFYLETPTWADLKFRVAFRAAFGLGTSAVHATFFHDMREDDDCVKIMLSKDQYQALVNYIDNTFLRDSGGNTQYIKTNANYGKNDAFYEAHGRYNIFKTCNTWVNNGLKAAGQKACLWTPFDKGIFWHYRN